MKRWILTAVVLGITIIHTGGVAMAGWLVPQLPQAFWGEVWLGGQPAPAGTVVEAHAENCRFPAWNNPFTLTADGKLGGKGGFDPKLVLQGDFRRVGGAGPIPVGAPVTFLVDGEPAWVLVDGIWQQTIPFAPGEVTHVLLAR